MMAAQQSNLFFGTGLLSDQNEVKLIDMTGKTVWTKVYPQADFQATVETSSLRNGVYQLMVRVNGNWIAKKLVISK